MKRSELEHLIRAAGAITQEESLVIIGSQSILGAYPDAPAIFLESREADMFPKNNPAKGEILDAIGEESAFDKNFGYYIQWVDESTATLPKGWKGRLVKVKNENTGGATGYCLDPLDLIASKLAAGRPKDHIFAEAFVEYGLGTTEEIAERIKLLPEGGSLIRQPEGKILVWLEGLSKRLEKSPQRLARDTDSHSAKPKTRAPK